MAHCVAQSFCFHKRHLNLEVQRLAVSSTFTIEWLQQNGSTQQNAYQWYNNMLWSRKSGKRRWLSLCYLPMEKADEHKTHFRIELCVEQKLLIISSFPSPDNRLWYMATEPLGHNRSKCLNVSPMWSSLQKINAAENSVIGPYVRKNILSAKM